MRSPRAFDDALLLPAGNGGAAVIMGEPVTYLCAGRFFVTAGFTLPALAALFRIKDSEVNAASAHGGVTDKKTSGIVPGVALLLRSRAIVGFHRRHGHVPAGECANASACGDRADKNLSHLGCLR